MTLKNFKNEKFDFLHQETEKLKFEKQVLELTELKANQNKKISVSFFRSV